MWLNQARRAPFRMEGGQRGNPVNGVPSPVVESLILTKSSKNGGYCVVGIDMGTHELVRFVSGDTDSNGALNRDDMSYKPEDARRAGKYVCQPLDLVKVHIQRPVPTERQPENLLIDSQAYWEYGKTFSNTELLTLLERVARAGEAKWTSRYIFGTSRWALSQDEYPDHSVEVIRATHITIRHERKTKASFTCNGCHYQYMSVTDPDYYDVPDGTVILRAYLVMSLPDLPYNDQYYKFVAKIFPIP